MEYALAHDIQRLTMIKEHNFTGLKEPDNRIHETPNSYAVTVYEVHYSRVLVGISQGRGLGVYSPLAISQGRTHTRCVRTHCEISNLWICEPLKYLSLRPMLSVFFIIVKFCKPLIRPNTRPGAHPVFNWLYEQI